MRTGGWIPPTQLPLEYPEPEGPLGRMQMLLTVGMGAVLLLVEVVDVEVAGQRVVEVTLVVVVWPPEGGFLTMQSLLLHLPPGQTLPQ